MTNPYIRAAAKHPHICEQISERASRRPEWAGKPAELGKLQAQMDRLQGKPDRPDRPDPRDRERARDVLGQFRGDNPETPDVNEAWEPAPEPPKRGRGRG